MTERRRHHQEKKRPLGWSDRWLMLPPILPPQTTTNRSCLVWHGRRTREQRENTYQAPHDAPVSCTATDALIGVVYRGENDGGRCVDERVREATAQLGWLWGQTAGPGGV